MALRASYDSVGLTCVEDGELAVAIWKSAPTVEDVQAAVAQAERGLAAHEGRTMLINAIVGRRTGEPAARPDFSGPVRRELVEFSKRDDLHRLGTAHLVLVDGFLGVTVRTFLTTISLVARPTTPLKVFSEVGAASTWLAERAGLSDWDPNRIQAGFEAAMELR